MNLDWKETTHKNVYGGLRDSILKSTYRNGFRKFINKDYSTTPEEKLIDIAKVSIEKFFSIKEIYGEKISPVTTDMKLVDSPLNGWRTICLTSYNGYEHVCINAEFLLSITEEIGKIKLLKKDGFPLKTALKNLNKNKRKLDNWKIKFISEDDAVLIINPDLELQYMIAPVIFNEDL